MTSTLNDSLHIDLVNTKAYPTISALPKTQGPICLYILQYDEKLDCKTIPFHATIYDFDFEPSFTRKGLEDAYRPATKILEVLQAAHDKIKIRELTLIYSNVLRGISLMKQATS
ncbi:unnamed protein product [Adineta steineri]|uniref:Uncharacterized protein n=1 Tax=Adineta steineri TaxID=433720 RepID=A0A815EE79_9BILA|nr:unnamed protein product [Adineta steineri]CAF1310508.1 unnamed protein product [Adineta steineri]CAF1323144.1 unnamed protein product [Adineta steineri]